MFKCKSIINKFNVWKWFSDWVNRIHVRFTINTNYGSEWAQCFVFNLSPTHGSTFYQFMFDILTNNSWNFFHFIILHFTILSFSILPFYGSTFYQNMAQLTRDYGSINEPNIVISFVQFTVAAVLIPCFNEMLK